MTAESEPLIVYRAANLVEARTLAAYLAQAGVEARVVGESLAGAFGGVAAGGLDQLEVWVAGADEPKARGLIAAWRTEAAATMAQRRQAEREQQS